MAPVYTLAKEPLLEQQTRELVDKAADFFRKNSLDKACAAFTHNPSWYHGPITIFLFDAEGICLVDQSKIQPLWKKNNVEHDFFNDPLIQAMIAQRSDGGWVTYSVRNSLKHTFVKTLLKGEKTYIIGAGFFNETPSFVAKLIVSAVKHYLQKLEYTKVFDIVSNNTGPLIFAGIYPVVIDSSGLCWAHGNDALLIGQNLLDSANSEDWKGYKKIIELVKKQKNGWVEFESMGLTKRAYAESYLDVKSKKEFIIAAGYYPTLTDRDVISVTNEAAKILNVKDVNDALPKLANVKTTMPGKVLKGDLHFMIIDSKGVIRVYTYQPQAVGHVGRNVSEYVDQKERPDLKMIFDLVSQEGSGWVSRFTKNSLERIYGLKVDTGMGTFVIITFGYYPYHHREIVKILVRDAYQYLMANKSVNAFYEIGHKDSPFIKGQYSINVYDLDGYCWLNGLNNLHLWAQDKEFANAPEGWVLDERTPYSKLILFKKLEKKLIAPIGQNLMISSWFYNLGKA